MTLAAQNAIQVMIITPKLTIYKIKSYITANKYTAANQAKYYF